MSFSESDINAIERNLTKLLKHCPSLRLHLHTTSTTEYTFATEQPGESLHFPSTLSSDLAEQTARIFEPRQIVIHMAGIRQSPMHHRASHVSTNTLLNNIPHTCPIALSDYTHRTIVADITAYTCALHQHRRSNVVRLHSSFIDSKLVEMIPR